MITETKIDLENIKNNICWFDETITAVSEEMYNLTSRAINKLTDGLKEKNQSFGFYANKRNTTEDKAELDNIIGKCGEIIVSSHLRKEYGFPVMIPDFKIYDKQNKSWDCDLPFSKEDENYPNCHVKTCSYSTSNFIRGSGSKYSWTFQYSDGFGKNGKDRLFDKPNCNELILFVYFPNIGWGWKEAKLVASAPWNKLQSILKEPISKELRQIKKCIYSKDLFEIAEIKNPSEHKG